MSYSVDTSALLDAWVRYYPPDVFDTLWQRLDALTQLVSCHSMLLSAPLTSVILARSSTATPVFMNLNRVAGCAHERVNRPGGGRLGCGEARPPCSSFLRHALPQGALGEVFDRALTSLLRDLAKLKFGAVENPRPLRGTAPGSRHIPAEVKRAVWLRDLGRCTFVGTAGRRYGSRTLVEFHHIVPFAAGGEATVSNLTVHCKRHNQYEADLYFGPRDSDEHDGMVREDSPPYGLSRSTAAVAPPVVTCFETCRSRAAP